MTGHGLPPGPYGRLPFDEVVACDTETTGLHPMGVDDDGEPTDDPYGPDRLCSAHFSILAKEGDGWRTVRSMGFLCDPGRPVPEGAATVNGFHWSGDSTPIPRGRTELLFQEPFAAMADTMLRFVGARPLLFHNAVFDMSVLDAELARAGMSPLAGPVVCTKKTFAEIMGLGRPDVYVPGTNLNALCGRLGVDVSARFAVDGTELHGAAVDEALAAACFAVLEPLGWMVAERAACLPHRRGRDFRGPGVSRLVAPPGMTHSRGFDFRG